MKKMNYLSQLGKIAYQSNKGWLSYNFEVQNFHNYVAEDVRVHKDSIFAFVDPDEYSQIAEYRDTNNDGFPDFVVLTSPNQAIEKEKHLDGDTNRRDHIY